MMGLPEKYPYLLECIAAIRFPYIFLDEFQDTTPIMLA
jgi:superfamily I DNA/RNA helicase